MVISYFHWIFTKVTRHNSENTFQFLLAKKKQLKFQYLLAEKVGLWPFTNVQSFGALYFRLSPPTPWATNNTFLMKQQNGGASPAAEGLASSQTASVKARRSDLRNWKAESKCPCSKDWLEKFLVTSRKQEMEMEIFVNMNKHQDSPSIGLRLPRRHRSAAVSPRLVHHHSKIETV